MKIDENNEQNKEGRMLRTLKILVGMKLNLDSLMFVAVW